jgi:hypothetical protein
LQAALVARDVPLIERLLAQWVHRQGVSALAALGQELDAADPEGWAWWQTLQSPAPEPVLEDSMLVAAETLAPLPRLEPQLPRATRPAPAPSHPAVVQLRAWLPDQETRRAA